MTLSRQSGFYRRDSLSHQIFCGFSSGLEISGAFYFAPIFVPLGPARNQMLMPPFGSMFVEFGKLILMLIDDSHAAKLANHSNLDLRTVGPMLMSRSAWELVKSRFRAQSPARYPVSFVFFM
jgi:hypothetical protein